MVLPRAALIRLLLLACLGLAPAALHGSAADYQLGDVAREDIVAPVAFRVVNPEATAALRQRVAQEVLFVLRHTPQAGAEAEREIRTRVDNARTRFRELMTAALGGRAPRAADAGTMPYARVLGRLAREEGRGLPLEVLAPRWLGDEPDAPLLAEWLRPLREVMGQPILASRVDDGLPSGQPVRLVPVQSLDQAPGTAELERPGPPVPAATLLSLTRARRLIESHFPADQNEVGRLIASYVRLNAAPDKEATELLRARRMEGVTANDSFEAGQVVVRRGQRIDRAALTVLAAMREKSVIGTLQTKLAAEQSIAGRISQQTFWIAGGLAGVGVILAVILWRLRGRPSAALVPLDGAALAGRGGEGVWRDRALIAEGKAERAQQAIRSGVMGWMRERIFQNLFRQRERLLTAQEKAEQEMRELEQRLGQLQAPLQDRIRAYERRIEELERELADKGEENRQLIGARIDVARQQLRMERERGGFGAN